MYLVETLHFHYIKNNIYINVTNKRVCENIIFKHCHIDINTHIIYMNDLEIAISFLLRLAVNHPTMDKHILGSLKRLFLQRNKEILCSKSPDAYNSCSNATTVHQFIKSHHTFAGSSSLADYYAENNPIDWIPKVSSVLQTIGQIMTMLSGENTNTVHQQRG